MMKREFLYVLFTLLVIILYIVFEAKSTVDVLLVSSFAIMSWSVFVNFFVPVRNSEAATVNVAVRAPETEQVAETVKKAVTGASKAVEEAVTGASKAVEEAVTGAKVEKTDAKVEKPTTEANEAVAEANEAVVDLEFNALIEKLEKLSLEEANGANKAVEDANKAAKKANKATKKAKEARSELEQALNMVNDAETGLKKAGL